MGIFVKEKSLIDKISKLHERANDKLYWASFKNTRGNYFLIDETNFLYQQDKDNYNSVQKCIAKAVADFYGIEQDTLLWCGITNHLHLMQIMDLALRYAKLYTFS